MGSSGPEDDFSIMEQEQASVSGVGHVSSNIVGMSYENFPRGF